MRKVFKTSVVLAFLVALSGLSLPASAAILYQTDFDTVPASYSLGDLNGQNGWSGSNFDVVDIGGNQVAEDQTSGTNIVDQAVTMNTPTIFFRVDMMNTTDAVGSNGWTTFMLRDGTSDVFAFALDDGNAMIQDRVSDPIESTNIGTYSAGVFGTFVGAYDTTSQTLYGWWNPDATDYYYGPSNNSANGSDFIAGAHTSLTTLRLRSRQSGSQFDNIIIADVATDVGLAAPVPESSSLMLGAVSLMGLLAFVQWRKRLRPRP